jgi:hypothetical protein
MNKLSKVVIILVLVFMPAISFGQRTRKNITCHVKVVDAKALPIVGAEIVAYEAFYSYGGQTTSEILARKKTGADGAVTMVLNVTGTANVHVTVRKEGFALGWDWLRNLDQTFEPYMNIVKQQRGPILNAPQEWITTKTDFKGRFSFDNIPLLASADFYIEAPGFASTYTFFSGAKLQGNRFIPGNDIRIVLPPEAKIEGQCVEKSTGKPVTGIKLLSRSDKTMYSCIGRAVSGEDGRFYMDSLPADEYFLQLLQKLGVRRRQLKLK